MVGCKVVCSDRRVPTFQNILMVEETDLYKWSRYVYQSIWCHVNVCAVNIEYLLHTVVYWNTDVV